ncbi:MAG: hypothetical protein Q7V05_02845 [Methanoregula sp.]|nr:hypothetical protein [Methanoregula sp.]
MRHDQVYTKLFRNGHAPECVWSGKPINDIALLHVDHMIPFAAGKNNNLRDLLPALEKRECKEAGQDSLTGVYRQEI